MSQKNRDAKSSARERLQAQREKEKARAKRGRQLKVAAAVVAVLAVAGGIAVWAASSGKDDSAPVAVPKGATGGERPTVPVGAADAPATLTVWEDFRCPACAQFENGYRKVVHELEGAGRLKSEYHLATIIDGNMGGKGSLNAGNAALCAQQAGKFRDYHDVLFQNQPEEPNDKFADKKYLIQLAGKVNGLVDDAFTACVNDGTYNGFVQKSNKAFAGSGYRGTPTILLNGKNIFEDPKTQVTPEKFKQLVEEATKGKKAGSAASPS